MKKAILFMFIVMICIALYAQPPSGISHQAVIRDQKGEVIASQQIGVRVSILKESGAGSAVYAETHTPVSNDNGLITFILGQGIAESSGFGDIIWSEGPYFLKTEADPAGGTNYSISGVTQFFAVPYALNSLSFYGDMNGGRISNLAEPVDLNDAVTKEYVNSLISRIEALEALLHNLKESNGPDKTTAPN